MEERKKAPVAGGTTIRAEVHRQPGSLSKVLADSVSREANAVNIGESFRRCRESVSAEDAARAYGLQIGRDGKTLCPYHPDHHPSMSFRGGRFRCWSCGASGNAIDLTMKLLGVDALGALRRLDADFHLGLPLDRPLSAAEREQAVQRNKVEETRRRFEGWRSAVTKDLCVAIRCANLAHKRGIGLTSDAERSEWWNTLTDCEMLAIREQARLEYWADLLASKDLSEQMEVFRDREGVKRICQAILGNT